MIDRVFSLLVLCIAASLLMTKAYASENRIALVIGNGRYENVPHLQNTVKDATSVAAALRETGFKSVTVASDLTLTGMTRALRQFSIDAERADWAVIYYAGHGLEINGTNFLMPIDAKIASDRDVIFEAINLNQVLMAAEGAKKLRLVILDACRENPFSFKMRRLVSSRNLSRGLARIEPDGGTIVVYAAKDGQVAWDGGGQNSPFTSAFLKHIRTPGLEINRMFRKIRGDVIIDTNKRQEPFVYGSLPDEDFYFLPSGEGSEQDRSRSPKADTEKPQSDLAQKEHADVPKLILNRPPDSSSRASSRQVRRRSGNIGRIVVHSGSNDHTYPQASRRHRSDISTTRTRHDAPGRDASRVQRTTKREIRPRQVFSRPRERCTMFNGTCL